LARAANRGRSREPNAPAEAGRAAGRATTSKSVPATGGGVRRPVPTVARWPLEIDDPIGPAWASDPSVALVSAVIADYRAGRADRAAANWHDDVVWRVLGTGPLAGEWTGAEQVFAYHRLAAQLSEGDYRQRLVALEGSRGSIVNAYLRTTARRGDRRLDMPTLVVFEIAGGRVKRVTELPGDREAWAAFWTD
jgi:ketosteroid isomerase-like protein